MSSLSVRVSSERLTEDKFEFYDWWWSNLGFGGKERERG